jgi:hypothetical protein
VGVGVGLGVAVTVDVGDGKGVAEKVAVGLRATVVKVGLGVRVGGTVAGLDPEPQAASMSTADATTIIILNMRAVRKPIVLPTMVIVSWANLRAK